MNTRQDMFEQNLIIFLLEQEKRKLITKEEYVEFYDFLEDWKRSNEDQHPREENTIDCMDLQNSGSHI